MGFKGSMFHDAHIQKLCDLDMLVQNGLEMKMISGLEGVIFSQDIVCNLDMLCGSSLLLCLWRSKR